MNNNYQELSECPITLSRDKFTYLNFGLMPLVNNLNNTKEESLNCDKYPLTVNYFPESRLSMLSIAINPNILFSHYVYKSGTSQPYVQHCKEMYNYISRFVKINEGDTFIDIGGNDGTLLSTFRTMDEKALNLINVDPSENLKEMCKDNNITKLTEMWNYSVGTKFKNTCKVITSTNVFQHTKTINSFAFGVFEALKDDGIWCLEFPYWGKDLETNQYDQVYHEHIYYYLLTPLFNLFSDIGLEIIDASKQSIHGGSLRIISKRRVGNIQTIPKSVETILDEEKKFDSNFYKQFEQHVNIHLAKSKLFLEDIKKSGKHIAGFGAAAKGCTFLNAAKIDYNIIDYIVDDTDTKQNKFVPGVGIRIVNRNELIINPPDYILILAHNFSEYIIHSVKSIYSGKFIVVFPEPIIYE